MLAKSGPAAGVLAATFLGEQLGIRNLITADMGGTSFDVCVIREGVPEIKDSSDVMFAIPLRSDSIDVHSIGAGGGSIAWIDDGGALRVGPRSAGAAFRSSAERGPAPFRHLCPAALVGCGRCSDRAEPSPWPQHEAPPAGAAQESP